MTVNGGRPPVGEVSHGKSEGRWLQRLQKATAIAIMVGGVGSVGLMLFAGRRNTSHLLRLIFIIWVSSPFIALIWLSRVSKGWSVITRATLYVAALVLTLSSLLIYLLVAVSPPKAQKAAPFIVVPPVSWVLMATVVPIVALISARKTRLARRILKGLAALMILVILGIGALSAFLWTEQRTELTLPTPTGPFAVGRAIEVWTDDGNVDALAPVPGTKRELLVWFWYPAAGPSGAITGYVPAQVLAPTGRIGGSWVWSLLTRDLSKVHARSTDNAELSRQQSSYPVVLMRGGASAPVLNYSALAEDLASHGYVVVGIDAPYRTSVVVFPDGRVITRTPENNGERCEERKGKERADCANRLLAAWTGDMAFVLDRLDQLNASGASGKFVRRLDLSHVGVFGHSFGGAQAAQFCHDDPRCKAGIDIDGRPFGTVVREGTRQPFMFLMSAQIHSSDPESREVKADIESIYDRLPADGRLRIAIRGANHFTFSDDGALLKSAIVRRTLRIFGMLGIDGRRQLSVTAYCVRSFFDTYLKSERGSPLKISSALYPEIEFIE